MAAGAAAAAPVAAEGKLVTNTCLVFSGHTLDGRLRRGDVKYGVRTLSAQPFAHLHIRQNMKVVGPLENTTFIIT